MSLDFGKTNFNTSLKPTSAFPLDAREYFESKNEADAAVTNAGEAGSKNSIYYIGQKITVVENNYATLYVIQPKDDTHSTPYLAKIDANGGEGGDYGAIVYLNTKEKIGRYLELQDVYPIQSYDTKLQIISKNRIKYKQETSSIDGVKIAISTNDGIKVTGAATSSINGYHLIDTINISTPGKYTISVNSSGVDNSDKKCYVTYSLINADDIAIKSHTKLTAESPIVINTEELNCNKIEIELHVNVKSGASFNASDAQTFKVQVEYGDVATPYTSPKDETNIGNKTINIYGMNLYSGELDTKVTADHIEINGERVDNATDVRTHYIKGIMTEDNNITVNLGSGDQIITTPLLKDDKFTFMYTFADENILNPQILYGHTDYSVYEPYEVAATISEADGTCSISNIKYPYSFLALEDVAANDGYAIYLRYDPALSRNWVEKQLDNIDKRLEAIEDGNNVVEQGIHNEMYYEKLNNGIVKLYGNEYFGEIVESDCNISDAGYFDRESTIYISKSICKSIISHNISVSTPGKLLFSQHKSTRTDGTNLASTYSLYGFTSELPITPNSVNHFIIGLWK